jgi:hypothetical protein
MWIWPRRIKSKCGFLQRANALDQKSRLILAASKRPIFYNGTWTRFYLLADQTIRSYAGYNSIQQFRVEYPSDEDLAALRDNPESLSENLRNIMTTMAPVLNAFSAANNGKMPDDLAQLAPYATTPEQQAALRQVLQMKQNAKSNKPAQGDKAAGKHDPSYEFSGGGVCSMETAKNLLMKTTIRSAGLMILGIGLFIGGGCGKMTSTSWKSIKNPEAVAQLKSFIAEKEAQVNAAAKAGGQEMMPEYKTLFAAAAKGNWPGVRDTFNLLSQRAPQYSHPGPSDNRLTGPQWAAVLETYGVFEAFAGGGDKYCAAFGREIIDSIPPDAVYFGGTDPGRFLVTALCKSQVNGYPFYVLTQNALADGGYLAYLRSMYGDKIYIPTDADSQQSFGDYQRAHGQAQVSGQVAVMAINGLLAKIVFDKNPAREFFIEESFPLDWMYPYLEPHGLIFKINRQPLAVLSDETVQRDHDYWTQLVTPMIGGWLNDNTSVQGIADFAKKVFLQHDFKAFTGDPQFVKNDYFCRIFSKERGSDASLYLWRMNHAGSSADRERMASEADFAFRQALALCPYNPQTASTHAGFLHSQHRDSDARLVNEIVRQFRNRK